MLHIPCQQRRMQQSLLQVPKWRWQSKIPWTRRKWRGTIIKNHQPVLKKNKYSVQNIDIKAADPMLQLVLCYHYFWCYTVLPSVCLLTSHPREQNSKVSKKISQRWDEMKGSPNLQRVLQMHSLITFTSKFTKLSKELENNSLLTGIREKWAWRAHQDVFRILLTPQNYKEHHSLLAARSYFPWELQHNHKMSLQTSDSQQQ